MDYTENHKRQIYGFDTAAVFIVTLAIFLYLVFLSDSLGHAITDTYLHSIQIFKINNGSEVYPPNFLFYFIVNALSFFSGNIFRIYLYAALLQALAISLRYQLTKKYILNEIISSNISPGKVKAAAVLVSLSLIFYFPIQDYIGVSAFNMYYLGKVSPNVWHNSTTIFLSPFALLLFWCQYKQLVSSKDVTSKETLIISLLVLINLFIKPSFIMAFAPVTSLMLFLKYGFTRKLLKAILPILIGVGTLYLFYNIIFVNKLGGYIENSGSMSLSKPFEAWMLNVPAFYIPIALIHSFAFPLAFALIYRKRFFSNPMIMYAVYLVLTGLFISAVLIEEGPRSWHCNFMWQNVICSYILTFTVVIEALKVFFEEGFNNSKFKIITGIFSLHVIMGLMYLLRFLLTNNYS